MPCQFVLDPDFRDFELMLQQCHGVRDDLVDVNFRELGAAGAGKVQQVVHNLRCTESLPRNLFEQSAFLRIVL